jgi:hypothetical protein
MHKIKAKLYESKRGYELSFDTEKKDDGYENINIYQYPNPEMVNVTIDNLDLDIELCDYDFDRAQITNLYKQFVLDVSEIKNNKIKSLIQELLDDIEVIEECY